MAKYRITAPDGHTYEITAPDDATEEQIAAYARENFPGKEKPSETMLEALFLKPAQAASEAAYKIGGKVTDITGSPALGYAANVGTQALPVVLAGPVAKLASKPFEAGAKSLMQSAIKPTLSQLQKGEAERAVNTLLKEGINPTKGGVNALREKITDINSQVADQLAQSGAKVTLGNVGTSILDPLKRFQNQVNPQSDVNALRGVWEQFRQHPILTGREEIPVQLAQQLKTGTYKQLAGKYGELGSASIEGQKALARGLKEEISKAVPKVAALNAKEGELLNALNVAERRALMDLNKNPMGLSLLAQNPATWAAFMADKSALFKSLVARMLYAGKEQIPATAARLGTAGYLGINQYDPDEQIPLSEIR